MSGVPGSLFFSPLSHMTSELGTFLSLYNGELYSLTFFQSAETGRLYSTVVNENVIAVSTSMKPKPFEESNHFTVPILRFAI